MRAKERWRPLGTAERLSVDLARSNALAEKPGASSAGMSRV